MQNSAYWKMRFEQLEQAQNGQGVAAFAEIEKQYKEAKKQLEGQIARWYQRFATNNGISLAEARQYLKGADLKEFKWDVQEYIKYGQDNALNSGWMKELKNASAKYHISKLEALKLQTQHSLEVMYAKQFGTMHGAMTDILKSGYYHTAYELQKGFNIGWDIAGLDQAQIEKVLLKPWAVDGKHVIVRPTAQEQEIAIILSKRYGKMVDFVPQIMQPSGIQTPDYLIDGDRFDLKSPTGRGKNLLYGMLSKKKKQAPNFIFDITNCPLLEEEIERQINALYTSQHTRFVEKIVVIKNKKVLKVYVRQ